MRIELITRVGDPPIVLDVAQFVVRNGRGTPIAAGAEYGPDDSQAVSCVGHPDLARVLRLLGVQTTVVVDRVVLPQPAPGARLLAGPRA